MYIYMYTYIHTYLKRQSIVSGAFIRSSLVSNSGATRRCVKHPASFCSRCT